LTIERALIADPAFEDTGAASDVKTYWRTKQRFIWTLEDESAHHLHAKRTAARVVPLQRWLNRACRPDTRKAINSLRLG
jgi:hypothetical protein